jgi:tetratricopeptide (TPR) repeat protein
MSDLEIRTTATSREFAPSRITNRASGPDLDYCAEQVLRAGRYLEAGKFEHAEACLRAGLGRVPDHPECTAYLGVCLAAGQRKYVTAEKLIKGILESRPYDPTAWYALGRINLLGGRREQAFANFAKARRVSRDDAHVEQLVDELDPRRPPVLGFLSRDHVLNRLLGRLRARLSA